MPRACRRRSRSSRPSAYSRPNSAPRLSGRDPSPPRLHDPCTRLRFDPLMTALQAAGGGLPLALHIPHVVEQAGSLAGFAAVIGLAVLSALYFSQARDLRRLREWAGRAPERAAEGPAGAGAGPGGAVPQRPAQAAPHPTPPAPP